MERSSQDFITNEVLPFLDRRYQEMLFTPQLSKSIMIWTIGSHINGIRYGNTIPNKRNHEFLPFIHNIKEKFERMNNSKIIVICLDPLYENQNPKGILYCGGLQRDNDSLPYGWKNYIIPEYDNLEFLVIPYLVNQNGYENIIEYSKLHKENIVSMIFEFTGVLRNVVLKEYLYISPCECISDVTQKMYNPILLIDYERRSINGLFAPKKLEEYIVALEVCFTQLKFPISVKPTENSRMRKELLKKIDFIGGWINYNLLELYNTGLSMSKAMKIAGNLNVMNKWNPLKRDFQYPNTKPVYDIRSPIYEYSMDYIRYRVGINSHRIKLVNSLLEEWLTQDESIGLYCSKLDEFLKYKLFQILLKCLKGQCLNESQRKVDESIGKIILSNPNRDLTFGQIFARFCRSSLGKPMSSIDDIGFQRIRVRRKTLKRK